MAVDDIQQAPFQPLVQEQQQPITQTPLSVGDTSASTDASVGIPADTGLELFMDNAYQPSKQKEADTRYAKIQSDFAKLEKQQNSAGPTIIAVLAALSGNFGPAMQLQEQKRKTQIGIAAAPHVNEINKLIREGDLDGAREYANNVRASLGPRSPEADAMLAKISDRITEREKNYNSLKTTYELAKNQITEDSPESQKRLVKGLGIAVKTRSEIASENLNNWMTRNGLKTQIDNGKLVQVGDFSGETKLTTLPEVPQEGELRGTAGDLLSRMYGRSKNELLNALRGQPIMVNGKSVQMSPAEIDMLKYDLSRMHGLAAELEVGPKTPITPQYAEELIRQNYKPLEINMRRRLGSNELIPGQGGVKGQGGAQFGEGVPTSYERERELISQRKMADFDVPLVGSDMAKNGVQAFNYPSGTPVDPNTTGNQVLQSNGQQVLLNPENAKHVNDVRKIVKDLSMVAQVIARLPNADEPVSRLGSFIDRELNQRLGVNPELTFDQVLQIIGKNSIENYFNSRNIAASRYNDLTKQLTSTSATRQGALKTLQALGDVLESDAKVVMKQGHNQGIPSPDDSDIKVRVPEIKDTPSGAKAPVIVEPGKYTPSSKDWRIGH